MVIRPRLTGYGEICFINVLGSDISTAAGCYHVFGGAITIRAPLVGPIIVDVTCHKVCLLIVLCLKAGSGAPWRGRIPPSTIDVQVRML